MAFNEMVREARLDREMTQEQLARALDKSHSTIQKWEGGTAEPSYQEFRRLCEYFGWPHPDLVPATTAPGSNRWSAHRLLDLVSPEPGWVSA